MAGSRSLKLRRADTCVVCGTELAAGTLAFWDAGARMVTCLACRAGSAAPEPGEGGVPATDAVLSGSPALERGAPGASARRRYEKLHAQREGDARERFGRRLGGLYLRVTAEPQPTAAWARGARGERLLGESLERLHDDATVVVLHDRRIPGSRANIDHIAVTSGGVWVIDAKNYTGRVRRVDKGGWFSNDERLYVGRRDCTTLVGGMAKQVEAIARAIGEPTVPGFDVRVHAALCFVEAEWSLLARPFALDGVWVAWPRALATLLQAEGELDPQRLQALARRVAERLPPA